jgi:hypothetical protein
MKFLAYVAPDGQFVEILGPYFSNGAQNDEIPECSEFFNSFDSEDEFFCLNPCVKTTHFMTV